MVLTERDEERLNLFYNNFKRAYDYEKVYFEPDLENIDEILLENFKFAELIEKLIVDEGKKHFNVNLLIKKVLAEYIQRNKECPSYYEYIKP